MIGIVIVAHGGLAREYLAAVEHVVGRGESFWSISRRYSVNTRQLAAWNGMAPGDTLSVGKTLVVWTNVDPGAVIESRPSTSPTPPSAACGSHRTR